MFRRTNNILKLKPTKQLNFRRNVASPGIKKPEVKKTTLTSHEKPSGSSSSSIKNGNVDQPLFPKGSVWTSYKKAIPGLIGGIASALLVMVIWPLGTVGASDALDSVPNRGDTAAVTLKKFNGEPVVDIPQTYAHLDKPSEDDDE